MNAAHGGTGIYKMRRQGLRHHGLKLPYIPGKIGIIGVRGFDLNRFGKALLVQDEIYFKALGIAEEIQVGAPACMTIGQYGVEELWKIERALH